MFNQLVEEGEDHPYPVAPLTSFVGVFPLIENDFVYKT
jgi:hypothetical protein